MPSRRAVIVGVLLVLGGGGLGVGVSQLFGGADRPVPSDTIVYEPSGFDGLDPFVRAADVGGCDPEALLAAFGADQQMEQAWAGALSLPTANVRVYIDSLRAETVAVDRARTDHGFVDGEVYAYHAILEPGTAVLVEEDGAPVVRCISGSPLTPPECPPNCKPEPTPAPEATPTPTPTTRRSTGGTTRQAPPPTAAPTQPPPEPTPAPTPQPTAAPTPEPTLEVPGA